MVERITQLLRLGIMATGWTCSLCVTESAESLCCCSNAETLLCRNCLVTHYTKYPRRLHQNLPLAAYGHHRTPGYFDRLNARTQAIEAGKEAFMKQLQSTDRCLEEISTKINELYQRIWEAGQKVTEEVKQTQIELRETVQQSIEEAEKTIYEDDPALFEKYTKALRTFTGNFLVDLFQYEVKVCENVDFIFNVTFKTADLNQLPEEEKLVPSPIDAEPELLTLLWTCRECGYENNQSHVTACNMCKKQNLTVLDSPISSQQVHVPQVPVLIDLSPQVPASKVPPSIALSPHLPVSIVSQAPEERKTAKLRIRANTTIWTCSCMYEYNLVTAEKCTKCNLPNPFLPAKPPPKKCVKCGTREITQPDNTCWSCHNNKTFIINPPRYKYWTCAPCDYGYNLVNGKCVKCKRTQEEVYPELKKNPTIDSPQKALWKCTKCFIDNEPSRMRCIGCDQSKEIYRCTTCGTPKEYALALCTQCSERRELQENKGIIRCSTCGSPKEYPLAVCLQCIERKELQENSKKETQRSNPPESSKCEI